MVLIPGTWCVFYQVRCIMVYLESCVGISPGTCCRHTSVYNTHRPLGQVHFPSLLILELYLRARKKIRSAVALTSFWHASQHNCGSSSCSSPALMEYQVISFRYYYLSIPLFFFTLGPGLAIKIVFSSDTYSWAFLWHYFLEIRTYCTYTLLLRAPGCWHRSIYGNL